MKLCIVCSRPANEIHEIFYGNGTRKEYSIKYGYQVPLCRSCHLVAHLRTLGSGLYSPLQKFDHIVRRKKWIQMRLCKLLGLNFQECMEKINKSKVREAV